MGLIEQARTDIKRITSDSDEWAISFTMLTPSSTFDNTFDETFQNGQVTIKGLSNAIHMAVEPESGATVNSRSAYVSFSEKVLTDLGYPVRNANGEVYLKNHRVAFAISTGDIREYVIREWYPDETVGLIVCKLGERK